MAVAVKRDVRQLIVGYMDQSRGLGLPQQQAVSRTIECLIADGLAADALREIGAWAIEILWRQQQPTQAAPEGARRVDVAPLKSPASFLETLVEVDGDWMPLGDLLRVHCQELSRRYVKLSTEYALKSMAYSKLVERMKSRTSSVREQLSEREVLEIFGVIPK